MHDTIDHDIWGIPLTKPIKNPKKWFNFRFVKRKLCPQSCINENVREENRVRGTIKGTNRNTLINNKKY